MIAKLFLISLLGMNSQSMSENTSAATASEKISTATAAENKSKTDAVQNNPDEKLSKQDAELEKLFSQVVFNISKSSFKKDGENPKDPNATGQPETLNDSTTIISLFDCTEIAGNYIRIMDVTEFRKDPEGLKTMIGPIIVSPSPAMDKCIHLSREQILQRLKEYNIPLNNLVVVGAQQVLVIRTNAAAHSDPAAGKEKETNKEKPGNNSSPSKDDNSGQDNIDQETKTDECAIKTNSPVLIVREGPLFRIEEWGSAKAEGIIGNLIKVVDHKGRTLCAKITDKDTVVPVEEQ